MLGDNRWKVLALVTGLFLAQAIDSPGRSARRIYTGLARYPVGHYRGPPMFVPRSKPYKKSRQSRVLFLDDEESTKQLGRGEIDLTDPDYGSDKVKFDETTDFDFTSPDADSTDDTKTDYLKDSEIPSGNERYYDAPSVPRIRPTPFSQGFIGPKYYQGRYSRPYAPNFFDPYFPVTGSFSPSVRNGYYGSPTPGGWKARSPRVVFPYTQDSGGNSLGFHSNSHQGGTGGALASGINFNNDNVVFRDQNFGLNDVSSADDLALQDLGTGAAGATGADSFADRDRGAHEPHHAKQATINRMDFFLDMLLRRPKYIPLSRNQYSTNEQFKNTKSTNILPPNIENQTHTNIAKIFGNNIAYIPKFKPISDEVMLKIETLINEPATVPNDITTAVPYKKYRKGKKLESPEEYSDSNTIEIATEPNRQTTKSVERQDEKKCPQGGSCEFFVYCWMVGGLLEGTCGLLKGCCHRVAKAGILGVQDSNSIEYPSGVDGGLDYGPVINDQSKSTWINPKFNMMWSSGKT